MSQLLVGGAAITLRGSAYVTQDVDFCCNWEPENLGRLAEAINEIHGRLRLEGVPDGQPAFFDARGLGQYSSVALITDLGYLDFRKSVDGIGNYRAVLEFSEEERFGTIRMRLITIEGLIRSKQAMKRPRDLIVLPELEMMQEAERVRSEGSS
ncbi:MAG: hypothetical protein NVS1B14_10590 [Vulcanimicrobiaceae bacterium]